MTVQKPIKPLSILDDAALMEKIQAGQTEKLGLLFERYHKQLYGFFIRLTRDTVLSEDLVQNVFFRILKYKKSYNSNKRFTTWMYQVARNVFHDQYRNKTNRETPVDDFAQNEPFEDKRDIIEESDQRVLILQKALEQLAEDKREILILSKYQGLLYKEIGEIFDCTETAIKVKAHRAMKELKVIYKQVAKKWAI